MEQELAPSAVKEIAGCCSFKGPVPPPLTIRYLKEVYLNIYVKNNIDIVKKFKGDVCGQF